MCGCFNSGGWKRLERQAVTREVFAEGVAAAFGCASNRVIDFYGMSRMWAWCTRIVSTATNTCRRSPMLS